MSADNNKIEWGDFIKATAAMIGAVLAIPSIAYLLSPALEEVDDIDSIPIGPLEKFPVGSATTGYLCHKNRGRRIVRTTAYDQAGSLISGS